MRRFWAAVGLVCCGLALVEASRQATPQALTGGTYVGTTPAGPELLKFIGADSNSKPELIEWSLSLDDGNAGAPTRFELRAVYGQTLPNFPGIARNAVRIERRGVWTPAKDAKSNPDADVIDLGGLTFVRIGPAVIHALAPDRALTVGNGGWSYSLNRVGSTEPQVDPSLVNRAPEMSYTIAPVSTGPTVYGIFEGRTPCHGIARELAVFVDPACAKVKWRITLYQHPRDRVPTAYKIEGSLFRAAAREGPWTVERGASGRTIYRLDSVGAGSYLTLLKGDDDVVFFLDRSGRPLVGNALLNYTLDRRR